MSGGGITHIPIPILDNSGYVVVVIPETPAAVAIEAMVLTEEEVLKGGNAEAAVRLVSLLLFDDENHPLLLPEDPSFERSPRLLRLLLPLPRPLPLLLFELVISVIGGIVDPIVLRWVKEKVSGACPTGLAETGEELLPPSMLAAVEAKTGPADSDFVCRRVVDVVVTAHSVAVAAPASGVVVNNPVAAAVCRGVRGLGEVVGRGPKSNLTRSISVFQCGIQRLYSSGTNNSFFSIILPRLTDDSKYGPSQKLHLCDDRR